MQVIIHEIKDLVRERVLEGRSPAVGLSHVITI